MFVCGLKSSPITTIFGALAINHQQCNRKWSSYATKTIDFNPFVHVVSWVVEFPRIYWGDFTKSTKWVVHHPWSHIDLVEFYWVQPVGSWSSRHRTSLSEKPWEAEKKRVFFGPSEGETFWFYHLVGNCFGGILDRLLHDFLLRWNLQCRATPPPGCRFLNPWKSSALKMSSFTESF